MKSKNKKTLPKKITKKVLPAQQPTSRHWNLTRLKRCIIAKRKQLVVGLVVVLGVCILVPSVRNTLLGLVVKRSLSIVVVDQSGGFRVSEADVMIDGKSYTTDQTGALLTDPLRPGKHTVVISKAFYDTYKTSYSTPVFSLSKELSVRLNARGAPVKVTVKNRISGRAIADVLIATKSGAKARTGADGTAQLILPNGTSKDTAILSGRMIKQYEVEVHAAFDDHTNVFMAVPAGRIYYLKAGAMPDVISANLDGSDPQVVLASTGQEDVANTELIASPQWRYLLLKSHQVGETKLIVIDTKDNSTRIIDQGLNYHVTGWIGDTLIYRSEPYGATAWQNKRMALKAYHADNGQQIVLDETKAEGGSVLDFAAQNFKHVFIADGKVLYTQHWTSSYYYGSRFTDKFMTLMSVDPSGGEPTRLAHWQAGYNAYIDARPNEAQELYLHIELTGVQHSYWRYYDGRVEQQDSIADVYLHGDRAKYFLSPNTKNMYWAKPGASVLSHYVSDNRGKNAKVINGMAYTTPIGWYTDDYILSTLDSGLYIAGRDGAIKGRAPLKITVDGRVSYGLAADYGL